MTAIWVIQAVWWAGEQLSCVDLCDNVLTLFSTNLVKWLLTDIIESELTHIYATQILPYILIPAALMV
jgi:hypothetical protein